MPKIFKLQEPDELHRLLDGCKKGNRHSQDKLYKQYYGYAMSICLRYSRDRDEAIEILNDGFFKIFTNLDKYTRALSFKGWLRKIMINTAIDYYRRNEKHRNTVDISFAKDEGQSADLIEAISEKEIITLIQLLPASYRMVFNLFVIEGYKHEEIAEKLDISVGTSKSNLSIARSKLKRTITKWYRENYKDHG